MSNQTNPYRAPEARIAIPGAIPLLPVYSAISTCCRLVATLGLLASGAAFWLLGSSTFESGWERGLFSGSGPRAILVAAVGVLMTTASFQAARMLEARRHRPGLVLCGVAVGLTYLGLWLIVGR